MANLTVTTLVDENDGGAGGTGLSLRDALTLTNGTAGADEILWRHLNGTVEANGNNLGNLAVL